MVRQNIQTSQWPSLPSWFQNNRIYVFVILRLAAENCFSDFYNEVSCFTLALSYFGRKTWDLKNTSAEFEIKGKKIGLLVLRYQIVFFCCSFWEVQVINIKDRMKHMINKNKIWSRKVIFDAADSGDKIPPTLTM